jgi:hypothetical protein
VLLPRREKAAEPAEVPEPEKEPAGSGTR